MALQDAKIVRLQKPLLMTEHKATPRPLAADETTRKTPVVPDSPARDKPTEHGGPRGLEPTRYGDWERNGKCVDF